MQSDNRSGCNGDVNQIINLADSLGKGMSNIAVDATKNVYALSVNKRIKNRNQQKRQKHISRLYSATQATSDPQVKNLLKQQIKIKKKEQKAFNPKLTKIIKNIKKDENPLIALAAFICFDMILT